MIRLEWPIMRGNFVGQLSVLLIGAGLVNGQGVNLDSPPVLAVTPHAIRFAQRLGQTTAYSTPVTVEAPSRPAFLFLGAGLQNWIEPSSYSGLSPLHATIRFAPAGMPAGLHTGVLFALLGLDPTPIPVKLMVFDPGGFQFDDVPVTHIWRAAIALLSATGITRGCSTNPSLFCPSGLVTQAEMAAFIVRAVVGEDFPYHARPHFGDVLPGNPFYRYVQRMAEMRITSGCGGGQFCPDGIVTRGEMAAVVIRALYRENFTVTTNPRFVDVPTNHPQFRYVQRMWELGITSGCSLSEYCPGVNIPREQMAAFLARAFWGFERVVPN